MKFTKLLFTSTTALGLSMTTALADGNETFLDQMGTDNSALIEQNGTNANAGDRNPQRRMTQDGNDNVLVILQTANGQVGTGSNFAQNNLGVDQLGDRNVLDVTQNFGSRVFEVQQDSNGATAPVSTFTNTTTIVQTGNVRVSRVRQTYTGDGASGTGNSLSVTQSGGEFQQSGIGDFNGFNNTFAKQGVWQEGASNSAAVTQTGAGHVLWLLDQFGETNSFTLTQTGGNGNKFQTAQQFGDDNVATFEFIGANNGNGTLSGAALASGAPNRSLLQNGDGNMMDMLVTGNDNQFGASQVGNLNDASIFVTGMSNDIGTRQESNLTGNEISANVAGDDNDLAIVQTVGNSPDASSVATVDITGNNNLLNVDQNSTRSRGGAQTVIVSIDGSDNNRGRFSGQAESVASMAGLNPGDMFQNRNGASATIDVIGSSNLFATSQSGNPAGTITGTINGNFNQAVVWAVGNNNSASFSQVGDNNNVGIIQ